MNYLCKVYKGRGYRYSTEVQLDTFKQASHLILLSGIYLSCFVKTRMDEDRTIHVV